MQLANNIDIQATGSGGGGLLGSALSAGLQTTLPVALVASLGGGAADATVQVDFVLSTPANQPDVRVTVPVVAAQLPVTTQLGANINAPQLSAATHWHLHNAGEAYPFASAPVTREGAGGTVGGVGSALRGVLRTSAASGHRWHPMRSSCRHGSGVPPCPNCRRAGLGGISRNLPVVSRSYNNANGADDRKPNYADGIDDSLLFYFSGREMQNARPLRGRLGPVLMDDGSAAPFEGKK